MAKALKLPTARGNALAAPVGGHDKPQANERGAAAIDSPSDLSGHKTPRQDIDALKEPDGPHQRHQNAHDVQNNSHHFRPVPTHLTVRTSLRHRPHFRQNLRVLPASEGRSSKKRKMDSPGKLGILARLDRARRLRVGFCHESWRVLSLIVAGIVTNSDNLRLCWIIIFLIIIKDRLWTHACPASTNRSGIRFGS